MPELANLMPISVGGADDLGTVTNKSVSFEKLCAKLSTPTRNEITVEEYLELSKENQGLLKKSAGYWIGAHCKNEERKKEAIAERSLICLDIDNGDFFGRDIFAAIQARETGLSQYEWFWHTTRSDAPGKPKLRIVIPLSCPVSAHDYDRVSRIAASMFDLGMASVDVVSFRLAQMMFWPTCSSDQEYRCGLNDGARLDPASILRDWDGRAAPVCPSEVGAFQRPTLARLPDPREKPGLLGAFCRAFSISDAIDQFLPDVFTLEDNERYRYRGSEGVAGAIVYDHDTHLFSHHGTDPYGARNLNAWDLVRLHLYGDRDKDAAPGTKTSKLPSTQKMKRAVKDLPEVLAEMKEEARRGFSFGLISAQDVDIVEDLSPEERSNVIELRDKRKKPMNNNALGQKTAEIVAEFGWQGLLMTSPTGTIVSSIHNIKVILQNDPVLMGRFRYDTFTTKIMVRGPVAFTEEENLNDQTWRDIADGDEVTVAAYLGRRRERGGYEMDAGESRVYNCMLSVATENSYSSVLEYLQSLVWDSVPRVDTVFLDYLGCKGGVEYHTEASRMFFLGLMGRILSPEGGSFRVVPILEGAQKCGKSWFVHAVGIRGTSGILDCEINDNKRVAEAVKGLTILEMPELKQMGKEKVEQIKAMITASKDRTRPAYGRNVVESIRRCGFIGTTNETRYLKDVTGADRFYPMAIPKGWRVDGVKLTAENPQIWAEAYHRIISGEAVQTSLGDIAEKYAEKLRRSRTADGAFAEEDRRVAFEMEVSDIEEWLNRPVSIEDFLTGLDPDFLPHDVGAAPGQTVIRNAIKGKTLWREYMGGREVDFSNRAAKQVAAPLRALGWTYLSKKIKGKTHWLYMRLEFGDLFTSADAPGQTQSEAHDL